MLPDADELYASLLRRDGQFEGLALVCVKTTGIFCRMTCPARTPLQKNVAFRTSVAECQAAGFRACKRCKPDQMGPDQMGPDQMGPDQMGPDQAGSDQAGSDQAGSPFAGSSSATVS